MSLDIWTYAYPCATITIIKVLKISIITSHNVTKPKKTKNSDQCYRKT